MIRLAFLHLRDTTNIGDRWCSPVDHCSWADPRLTVTAADLRKAGPEYDIGIFGGGKILRDIARSPAWLGKGRLNIGWGVSTVQSNPLSPTYWKAKRRLNLIGSRDWDGAGGIGGCDWVPCASAEHPFFDAPPPPSQEVVVYAHASKSAGFNVHRSTSLPWRINHGSDLVEALQFLASGETVVSNSYHGVFWALLLGRKVLCVPFSNKFGNFRLPPGYSTDATWPQDLSLAQAQPELLALCRTATAGFRAKVQALIESRIAQG